MSNSNSGWPACAMLSWGTLGKQDAAGRRYQTRTAIALAAMVVGLLGSALLKVRPIMAVVPGLFAVYIGYEFRRYLNSVDELARRILLESVAWAYLVGGVLLMFTVGALMAYDVHVDAVWLFMGLAPVEGMRGTILYFVARRYQ